MLFRQLCLTLYSPLHVVLVCPLPGLKQYYKLVQSHPLPHMVFQEKVQHLLELFSKIPFNQALVFSNLHTRYFNAKYHLT